MVTKTSIYTNLSLGKGQSSNSFICNVCISINKTYRARRGSRSYHCLPNVSDSIHCRAVVAAF